MSTPIQNKQFTNIYLDSIGFSIIANYTGHISYSKINPEYLYSGTQACRNNNTGWNVSCGVMWDPEGLNNPVSDYPGVFMHRNGGYNVKFNNPDPSQRNVKPDQVCGDLGTWNINDPNCQGSTKYNNSPNGNKLECCGNSGSSCSKNNPPNTESLWTTQYGFCCGSRGGNDVIRDKCVALTKNWCVTYDLDKTLTIGGGFEGTNGGGTVSNIEKLKPIPYPTNYSYFFGGREGDQSNGDARNGWPITHNTVQPITWMVKNGTTLNTKPILGQEAWGLDGWLGLDSDNCKGITNFPVTISSYVSSGIAINYAPRIKMDDWNHTALIYDKNLNIMSQQGTRQSATIFNFIKDIVHMIPDGKTDPRLPTNTSITKEQIIEYTCLWAYIYSQLYTWYNDLFGRTKQLSGLNFLNNTADFLTCIRNNVYFTPPPSGTTCTNSPDSTIYCYADQKNSTSRSNLDNILKQKLQKPIASYDSLSKNFQLTFIIPFQVIWDSVPTKTGAWWSAALPETAENIMSTLLQDKTSQITIGSNKTIPNDPKFKNIKDQPENNKLYVLSYDWKDNKIVTTAFTDPQDPNFSDLVDGLPSGSYYIQHILCKFKVNVSKWSPMLLIYFNDVFNMANINETVIGNLFLDLKNSKLPFPSVSYGQSSMSKYFLKNTVTNIELMKQLCSIQYLRPERYRNPSHSCLATQPVVLYAEKFLVYSDSPDCKCINNGLVPPSITGKDNAGICFSNTCNNVNIPWLSIFNLSDADCKQYCNDIEQWVTNKSPNPQSLRPENIDTLRFAKICGKNFKPYQTENINKNVLIPMLLLSLLIIITTILVLRKNKVQFIFFTIIILVIASILIGTSIFLGKDLAGTSYCVADTKTGFPIGSECTSKITNRKINQKFCKYQDRCECYGNDTSNISKACGGNCKCVNTMCISNDGNPRKTSTIYKREPKVLESIYITVFSINLIILYLLLNSQYKYTTSIKINVLVIYIFIILIIFVITYINLKYHKQDITEKNCSPLPPPPPPLPPPIPCKIGYIGDAKLSQCLKAQPNAVCLTSTKKWRGAPDEDIQYCMQSNPNSEYIAYNAETDQVQCCSKDGNSQSSPTKAWSVYQLVGDSKAKDLTYDCYTDQNTGKNRCVDYRNGTGQYNDLDVCKINCQPPSPPPP